MTLLDRVLSRLRDEYATGGKAELFRCLRPFIAGTPVDTGYAEVAQELGVTAGSAKVAAHRLRKRYRELLRHELTQTVADPADIDDEINWLFQALS